MKRAVNLAIKRFGDLEMIARVGPKEVLKTHGIGRKGLREIEAEIIRRGLWWGRAWDMASSKWVTDKRARARQG